MGFQEVLNKIQEIFAMFLDFFKNIFGMLGGKSEEETTAAAE